MIGFGYKTDSMIGTSLPYARANAGPKDSFGEDFAPGKGIAFLITSLFRETMT